MPIECARCHVQTSVVYFRRLAGPKGLVGYLMLLLWVSSVISVINVVRLIIDLLPLLDAADGLEQTLKDNPVPNDEVLHDGVLIFSNASYLFFLVVCVALVAIPVRYMFLLARLPYGNPRTLVAVRRAAFIQLILEFVGLIGMLIIFGGTEQVQVVPSVGLNLLTAPIILWYTVRPKVLQHFSAYEVKAMAAERAPYPPTGGGPPAGWAPAAPAPPPAWPPQT